MDAVAAAFPVAVNLPVSASELDAGLAALYLPLVRGRPLGEVLNLLCLWLAKRLALPLVTMGRRLDNGAVALEATSSENALWLDFQRIQQRWDGGVASRGPAGTALNTGAAARLSFSHDDLSLWRSAAEREKITEVLALPITSPAGRHVLELFCAAPLSTAGGPNTVAIESLVSGLAALLADHQQLEAKSLLAEALEAAGNAAFITDNHGTIQWSNPAFSALTGYSKEEVQGSNPSKLKSGQQGLRYYRELWNTIRSGKVWSGETVDRDKDGNPYTIRQTISPLPRNGRISHYLSIHDDISQQKRQQTRLELASGVDRSTGLLTPAAFVAAAHAALAADGAESAGLQLLVISLRGIRRAAGSFDSEMEDFLTDALGERLRQAIPAGNPVAALRAYEYAALFTPTDLDGETPRKLLENLRLRLTEPLPCLGNTLDVDLHLGVARYPADGHSYEALLLAADRQLADEPAARARHMPG